jgi:hypothetical protein
VTLAVVPIERVASLQNPRRHQASMVFTHGGLFNATA